MEIALESASGKINNKQFLVYSIFNGVFFYKKNVIDSRHFKAIPAELKTIILDYLVFLIQRKPVKIVWNWKTKIRTCFSRITNSMCRLFSFHVTHFIFLFSFKQ